MARYGSVEPKPHFLGQTSGLGSFSRSTYQSHYTRPTGATRLRDYERSLARLGLRLAQRSSSPKPPFSPFDAKQSRRGWSKQEVATMGGSLEDLVATGCISVQEYRERTLSEMHSASEPTLKHL
ncbi:unnamed protein product [Effrenium voratum]|nr:unnamed protein product [Effrenium voratum]